MTSPRSRAGSLLDGLRLRRVFPIAFLILSMLSGSALGAASIVVTSNPLWTDTGIVLAPSNIVIIHDAAGLWRMNPNYPWSGPEGTYLPYQYDEWITNGYHGELIGFIGASGVNPNVKPRVVAQNDARLFAISTNAVALTGVAGKLWLGCNDAWGNGSIGDNTGTLTARVDLMPFTASIQLSRNQGTGEYSVQVSWPSPNTLGGTGLTNCFYQVQYCSDLTTNDWTDFAISAPGTGGTNFTTDVMRPSERRYYRVVRLP